VAPDLSCPRWRTVCAARSLVGRHDVAFAGTPESLGRCDEEEAGRPTCY